MPSMTAPATSSSARPPPKPPSDEEAIYKEAYDGAYYELDEFPPESRKQTAQAIAASTVEAYRYSLNQSGGKAGAARADATQILDQEIRRIALENRVTTASERVHAAEDAAAAAEGSGITGEVNAKDIKDAADSYRGVTAKSFGEYNRILDVPPAAPGAMGTFNKVTTSPVVAAQMTPAQRIQASLQEKTTVAATDTKDLEATAAGQGAGNQAAQARMQQALQQSGQQASGLAQQARGSERRGARRAAMNQAGEANLTAAGKIEELNAQDRMQAQGKIADLRQQRSTLQANLDAARAKGDQDAINDITKKMADIDLETNKVNVGETNKVNEGNEGRSVEVQGANNTQGLAAQGQADDQGIAHDRLKMDAGKAAMDAAKGLLDQGQIQEQILQARQNLARLAKELQSNIDAATRKAKSEERSFWTTTLTSLLTLGVAATAGPAAPAVMAAAPVVIKSVKGAKHGGLVTRPTTLEVGEGGSSELIIPIRGHVSERLAALLAIENEPFKPDGKDEIDKPADLVEAIAASLKKFKAKKAAPVVAEMDDDEIVSQLAAATVRSRKLRGA